jgi:hypothetical protein
MDSISRTSGSPCFAAACLVTISLAGDAVPRCDLVLVRHCLVHRSNRDAMCSGAGVRETRWRSGPSATFPRRAREYRPPGTGPLVSDAANSRLARGGAGPHGMPARGSL